MEEGAADLGGCRHLWAPGAATMVVANARRTRPLPQLAAWVELWELGPATKDASRTRPLLQLEARVVLRELGPATKVAASELGQ